jgi:hypothetical protein
MPPQHRYILDETGAAIPCPEGVSWGQWFISTNRNVALDRVDGIEVRTTFIATVLNRGDWLDNPNIPPLLWETLIGGGHVADQYASREEAIAGHARWLARVQAGTWQQE